MVSSAAAAAEASAGVGGGRLASGRRLARKARGEDARRLLRGFAAGPVRFANSSLFTSPGRVGGGPCASSIFFGILQNFFYCFFRTSSRVLRDFFCRSLELFSRSLGSGSDYFPTMPSAQAGHASAGLRRVSGCSFGSGRGLAARQSSSIFRRLSFQVLTRSLGRASGFGGDFTTEGCEPRGCAETGVG